MTEKLRYRFWGEAVLALISACLCAVTLVWHDWIEIVFRVDPDQHNGTLEWAIVVALLLVAVASTVLARAEWRKVALAA